MVYAVRSRKCDGCTTVVKGRIPPGGEFLCIECAIAKAIRAATEMANKSGPAYDRWLKSPGPKGRPRTKPD